MSDKLVDSDRRHVRTNAARAGEAAPRLQRPVSPGQSGSIRRVFVDSSHKREAIPLTSSCATRGDSRPHPRTCGVANAKRLVEASVGEALQRLSYLPSWAICHVRAATASGCLVRVAASCCFRPQLRARSNSLLHPQTSRKRTLRQPWR